MTIFDPEAIPVVRVDNHLPAIARDALQPMAMRMRLANPPAWSPEISVERRFSERQSTAASVLVPLMLREELTVLLTQRTDHLADHPGQVSFPGGRREPEDVDAVATALREAEEEIGLNPEDVEVIGEMPTYTTGTGFVVTPVVALVRAGVPLTLDPQEVADVFEVPLAFLMNPANHRWHAVEMGGAKREFLSMPWLGVDANEQSRNYYVWGATAAMLRNLYRLLAA